MVSSAPTSAVHRIPYVKTHTGYLWLDQCAFHAMNCFRAALFALQSCRLTVPLPISLCPTILCQCARSLLSGMTCLRCFTKGASLCEQSTRSGSKATSHSLSYILTDVSAGARQALGRGQSMHRLHSATVLSCSPL